MLMHQDLILVSADKIDQVEQISPKQRQCIPEGEPGPALFCAEDVLRQRIAHGRSLDRVTLVDALSGEFFTVGFDGHQIVQGIDGGITVLQNL